MKNLTDLTDKERKELAARMVSPIRCGGAEYIKGCLHYRIGGWLIPDHIVHDGWEAIHEFQATHTRY
jgi:hypothetical protein